MSQPSKPILTGDNNDEFTDAFDEFPFFDAPNSFDSEPPFRLPTSSSAHNPNHTSQDSVSKASNPLDTSSESQSQSLPLSLSPGLRHRRLHSKRSSKSRCKNSSDGLAEFEIDGSDVSLAKSYKLSWKLEDGYKLDDRLDVSRVSVERIGDSINSLNSSAIVTLGDDGGVNDRSVTVDSADSPDTGSNLVFVLIGLIIKVISFHTNLLVVFITCPIWLTHSSYMFVTDPFAIMRRVKRYAVRRITRFLKFCLGNVKWIVNKCVKRNRSICKFCLQMGWGLLSSALVGFVLVGLLVFAFVVDGVVMQHVMEQPVRRIEQLNFDYTRDSPMAFVPRMSCPKSFCLECNEKIKFGGVTPSRVIPPDHKVQATVLLTLPESDYNRNLGNFQVKVDFLSSNGKSLASATQPCTMHFKSWPIRLLMTVFKLVPLITGYSLETQNLDIKFNGYTEQEIPTCCVRVVLEPRAEFAKGGGVPQIYTAYLKLESQLPLLKRILWSWKATVFVWTGIMIFTMVLVFMLLCCVPVFVSRPQLRSVPVNNTGSS